MAGIAVLKDNTRLFVAPYGETITAANKMGNISQVGDIASTAEEIDTTTIDSMAKEFEAGFTDNGSIELTQNLTQYEYSTMAAYQDNGDDVAWAISSFNKKKQQVIGIKGKGTVMGCTLTGISVGGLLQVVTSIRISGNINRTFVDPIGPVSGIPVTDITVSGMGGVSTITEKGGTLQCVAAVEPDDASNTAVTWSVDQVSIATISATGLLTAKTDGTVKAIATARDGSNVKGELEVTVSGQS